MKKNRILALLCALLMLFSCVTPVCALIAVEDENGVVHYSTDETTTAPSALKQATQKAIDTLQVFWHRWGVLTVIIVLLAAIVIAITISEKERQKKEKPPKPEHGKKS